MLFDDHPKILRKSAEHCSIVVGLFYIYLRIGNLIIDLVIGGVKAVVILGYYYFIIRVSYLLFLIIYGYCFLSSSFD